MLLAAGEELQESLLITPKSNLILLQNIGNAVTVLFLL